MVERKKPAPAATGNGRRSISDSHQPHDVTSPHSGSASFLAGQFAPGLSRHATSEVGSTSALNRRPKVSEITAWSMLQVILAEDRDIWVKVDGILKDEFVAAPGDRAPRQGAAFMARAQAIVELCPDLILQVDSGAISFDQLQPEANRRYIQQLFDQVRADREVRP